MENSIKVTVTYINLRQEWNKLAYYCSLAPRVQYFLCDLHFRCCLTPWRNSGHFGQSLPRCISLSLSEKGQVTWLSRERYLDKEPWETELNKQECKEMPGMKQVSVWGSWVCGSSFLYRTLWLCAMWELSSGRRLWPMLPSRPHCSALMLSLYETSSFYKHTHTQL